MSSESKSTTGVTAIGDVPIHEVLKRNNYFVDDTNGEEVGEDLVRDATSIVKGSRPSSMKEEGREYIGKLINRYSTANKLTFPVILWDSLLSQTHCVQVKMDVAEGEPWARESYNQKVEYVRKA